MDQSFSKEIVRLATTMETIFFVNKTEIPEECRGNVTYGRILFTYHDVKKDKFWPHITMGGNLINYPGDCRTPTADLLTVKLLLNSVISTPKCKTYDTQPQGFLLDDTHDMLQVFPNEVGIVSPRHH
jgi:hypothetical protein